MFFREVLCRELEEDPPLVPVVILFNLSKERARGDFDDCVDCFDDNLVDDFLPQKNSPHPEGVGDGSVVDDDAPLLCSWSSSASVDEVLAEDISRVGVLADDISLVFFLTTSWT